MAEFRNRLYITGVGALLSGTANVIMQLALPPVGYAVVESPVERSRITKHPLRRFRTTFTYLAVALLGTDEERARFGAAVDHVHRQVRSTAASPVRYSASDPRLQLWVAACLYYGTVDLYDRMYGPMDDATADAFYRFAARLGTTLQVPEQLWPADRAKFARYWTDAVAATSIDEPVRRYLRDLMLNKHLPRALRGSARFSTWITAGFLPQHFRDQMDLSWSAIDEQRFARLLRAVGAVQRVLPLPIRRFPFNVLLWDMRLRCVTGRPLL